MRFNREKVIKDINRSDSYNPKMKTTRNLVGYSNECLCRLWLVYFGDSV